jgi:hypothetical protein
MQMDYTVQDAIDILKNPVAPDLDVSGAILYLRLGFEEEGLIPLLQLIQNKNRSFILRQEAADTISYIGVGPIMEDLFELRSAADAELKKLINIALTPPK